jgi:hypothetical protein
MSGVSYVDSGAAAGGTDATSTNQATQITLETAIRDRIGEVQASPTANTLLDRVKALLTGIVLAAGANRIGKVTVRNAADAADIDPVAEGTFTGRIGEVQASPTSNTVLDRLKQLLTGTILAAGSARIGKVTVRNAADAADIDPLAEATFTGRVGEVQASPTANTVLDRLKALLTGIVLAAGENYLGFTGRKFTTSTVSFARPADTTAYAAKDAVSNSTSSPSILTFSGAGRVNAGTGTVVGVRITTDQSTNTAEFRLHLYAIAPTAINDNAAFTLLWANRDKRIGAIDIGPLFTEGSGSDAASDIYVEFRLPFKCDTSDTNLYAMLETLSAFTPASAQNFHISLSVEQN